MVIVYMEPQNRRGCGLVLQGGLPRTCGFEPMARPQVPPERKQTATFFLLGGSMSVDSTQYLPAFQTIFFCCIIRIIFDSCTIRLAIVSLPSYLNCTVLSLVNHG